MMQRKIIHIDMDCFYAAIEVRDNPDLQGKPIAVGGHAERRGVLCTCSYEAREFGVRSAMATARAMQLCPDLLVLPVNMEKYKQESAKIKAVFAEYTDLIEPLSLDEAYLDVSESSHCQGSATLIAKEIKAKIKAQTGLVASAGVADSKFLAKVASDWEKPDGLFVVTPEQKAAFIAKLPVKSIPGVGKVTDEKFQRLGVYTCADLMQIEQAKLAESFGAFGQRLYNLCRGIDPRPVEPHRERKSLSVEETFAEDKPDFEACEPELPELYTRLLSRLERLSEARDIHGIFVKLKFCDFTQTTVDRVGEVISLEAFRNLCEEAYRRQEKPVRLIGIGLRFRQVREAMQLSLGFATEKSE